MESLSIDLPVPLDELIRSTQITVVQQIDVLNLKTTLEWLVSRVGRTPQVVPSQEEYNELKGSMEGLQKKYDELSDKLQKLHSGKTDPHAEDPQLPSKVRDLEAAVERVIGPIPSAKDESPDSRSNLPLLQRVSLLEEKVKQLETRPSGVDEKRAEPSSVTGSSLEAQGPALPPAISDVPSAAGEVPPPQVILEKTLQDITAQVEGIRRELSDKADRDELDALLQGGLLSGGVAPDQRSGVGDSTSVDMELTDPNGMLDPALVTKALQGHKAEMGGLQAVVALLQERLKKKADTGEVGSLRSLLTELQNKSASSGPTASQIANTSDTDKAAKIQDQINNLTTKLAATDAKVKETAERVALASKAARRVSQAGPLQLEASGMTDPQSMTAAGILPGNSSTVLLSGEGPHLGADREDLWSMISSDEENHDLEPRGAHQGQEPRRRDLVGVLWSFRGRLDRVEHQIHHLVPGGTAGQGTVVHDLDTLPEVLQELQQQISGKASISDVEGLSRLLDDKADVGKVRNLELVVEEKADKDDVSALRVQFAMVAGEGGGSGGGGGSRRGSNSGGAPTGGPGGVGSNANRLGSSGGGRPMDGVLQDLLKDKASRSDLEQLKALVSVLGGKVNQDMVVKEDLNKVMEAVKDKAGRGELNMIKALVGEKAGQDDVNGLKRKAEGLAHQLQVLVHSLQEGGSGSGGALDFSKVHVEGVLAGGVVSKEGGPEGSGAGEKVSSTTDGDGLERSSGSGEDVQHLQDAVLQLLKAVQMMAVGHDETVLGNGQHVLNVGPSGGDVKDPSFNPKALPPDGYGADKSPPGAADAVQQGLRDTQHGIQHLKQLLSGGVVKRKMDALDPSVLPKLAQRLASLEALVKAPNFGGGRLPHTGTDHSRDVDSKIKKLNHELKVMKEKLLMLSDPSSPAGRLGEGDHAMLAGKPVMGYRCMACDRPLTQLEERAGPYVPTNVLLPRSEPTSPPRQRAKEESPEEGNNSSRRKTGTVDGERGPQTWYEDTHGPPAVALPPQDVGPHLPPGGWRGNQRETKGSPANSLKLPVI